MSSTTVYASGMTPGRYGRDDARSYLERIGLDPAQYLDQKPSYELLCELQASNIYAIPFESTSVHVKDWSDEAADIRLGGGETVGLGAPAFHRITKLWRGGYCFSVNSSFAALLRYFDFRVSEVAARVYGHLGQDPDVVGYDWQPTSHQCSIVDWDGSGGNRYFCDIGFGSAQSIIPIPFRDGASVVNPPPTASMFKLVRSVYIPGFESTSDNFPDPLPYWTVYSKSSVSSSSADAFWSPTYTFALASVAPIDFTVLNHYNSSHPKATFVNFFVCTKLVKATGERVTLYFKDGMVHDGKRCAKLQRPLISPNNGDQLEHEEWIEMKVGPIKRVLSKEFGFKFPSDYGGN